MISKFTNLFKKTDLDEKNAFRRRVLRILENEFPAYRFTVGDDPEQISFGEITLGLTNLRAKFLLTAQTQNELEILVREQFAHLPKTAEYFAKIGSQGTWESVKELVVLQIMPLEYAEKFSAVNYPLGEEAVIGIVVDDENAYRYATENNLHDWKISADELYETALQNLKGKSANVEMTMIPSPVGLVIINTMDSFDAARILLPNLREFFAAQIGSPFYFGIPNRDFLICFAADSEEEMQNNIRRQIVTDNAERPYPLSRHTFVVDGKNEIKQLPAREANPPYNLVNLN